MLISYMFRNLIVPYFMNFHISIKYMYCKIRFNNKRQIDFWIFELDDAAYNKCLSLPNNTPVISLKKILFSFEIILWNFFCFLKAKSSVILWFKTLLRTDFSNQIHQKSGVSLKVFNEYKFEVQFGSFLGIAPSRKYVFWSLTSTVTTVYWLKTDDSLMSSSRKCSSHN